MRYINKNEGYTDRMKEIDGLLEKYYYQFLEEGYSCQSSADKAHEQLADDGIPYEEHYNVSLSRIDHNEPYAQHPKEQSS